jgi:putative transcriptional regulator
VTPRLVTAVVLVAAVSRGVPGVPAAAGGQLQPGAVKALGRGKILVAGRQLGDPNFAEAVVLLVEHSPQGSMGLIINRQSDTPLSRLLDLPKSAKVPLVFQGGPVEGTGILALLRSETDRADTKRILDGVYQITAPGLLNDLVASSTGPERLRVYFGYSGWAPDQLERETRAGAWHVFEGSAQVVFDPDPATLWDRQIPRADDQMASVSRY